MLRSMCSLKRKCKHVPKYLPLDLLCMHCNHNLLSQQCSPKHVRTGCDVIKTCWMGLSPASSMILLYKFAITLKAIYFGHSHVLLLHSPCVHRALSVHKIFANTNTHTHTKCKHISKIVPQNCQPTRTVPQPRASFSEELQLCSEASSLPLNHGTLILRTCRLAAFHFMQLHLKALLISAKLKPQLGKHFVLLHDDHHILHEVIRPL